MRLRHRLLILLLALLHLLHDLLWRAGRRSGREVADGSRFRWRSLIVRFVFFDVIVWRASRCGLLVCGLTGAQQELARRTLAEIADHDDVVAGALQKLGEDIARLAGSVCAKDTLI